MGREGAVGGGDEVVVSLLVVRLWYGRFYGGLYMSGYGFGQIQWRWPLPFYCETVSSRSIRCSWKARQHWEPKAPPFLPGHNIRGSSLDGPNDLQTKVVGVSRVHMQVACSGLLSSVDQSDHRACDTEHRQAGRQDPTVGQLCAGHVSPAVREVAWLARGIRSGTLMPWFAAPSAA